MKEENIKHNIVLLNHGPVIIENNTFYKLEYCFADTNLWVDTLKRKGAVPHQVFCSKDLSGLLKLSDTFKSFVLEGVLVVDYKNPLNQKFKPKKLTDTQSKNVIDLSE